MDSRLIFYIYLYDEKGMKSDVNDFGLMRFAKGLDLWQAVLVNLFHDTKSFNLNACIHFASVKVEQLCQRKKDRPRCQKHCKRRLLVKKIVFLIQKCFPSRVKWLGVDVILDCCWLVLYRWTCGATKILHWKARTLFAFAASKNFSFSRSRLRSFKFSSGIQSFASIIESTQFA